MNRLYRNPSLLLVSAIYFLTIVSPLGSVAQESHTGKLIEGAKKEASLDWYTSTSIEDIKRLFDPFNKKYPFIKTEFFNAGSADDLLDPQWKGKIAMDEEMYSWYAAMAVAWGREKAQRFMKALAKQDIQLRTGQSLMRNSWRLGSFPWQWYWPTGWKK